MTQQFKVRDMRDKYFQIDDEYLNGYAKLCGINATGVYLSFCRHANKQQTCFPSKKLIAEELAISERSVYSAIKKLEEWNIIKVEQQGKKANGTFINNTYLLLNKTEWKSKPQARGADGTVGKICIPPQANNDIQPQARGAEEGNTYIMINHTHNNNQTHTSEPSSQDVDNSSSNNGIKQIMDIFYQINPTINWGNKTTRSSCIALIAKFGLEETLSYCSAAISVQGQPYAPVITTPYQLKEKLTQLIIYLKKQTTGGAAVLS